MLLNEMLFYRCLQVSCVGLYFCYQLRSETGHTADWNQLIFFREKRETRAEHLLLFSSLVYHAKERKRKGWRKIDKGRKKKRKKDCIRKSTFISPSLSLFLFLSVSCHAQKLSLHMSSCVHGESRALYSLVVNRDWQNTRLKAWILSSSKGSLALNRDSLSTQPWKHTCKGEILHWDEFN